MMSILQFGSVVLDEEGLRSCFRPRVLKLEVTKIAMRKKANIPQKIVTAFLPELSILSLNQSSK